MRKIVLISLVLILATAIAYLGYSILQKDKREEIIQNQISQLPDLTLRDINGNSYLLKKKSKNQSTLLVYFNSTCQICQTELGTISKRIKEFDAYKIIFVTVESPEEITEFVAELELGGSENINFLIDSEMEVASYYGIKGVPALYIYDSTSSLIENYTGPVKVDLILDKLKQGRRAKP